MTTTAGGPAPALRSLAVNGKAFAREARTGVVRVAERLLASLLELRPGLEITVYAPLAPGEELRLPGPAARVRARTFRSRLYASGIGRSAWEQLVLPGAVRRGGHDVLLDPSNSAPVLRSPGIPQLLLVHDCSFLEREWFTASFSRYLAFVLRRAARRVRAVVTVSETSAAELRAAFPDLPGIEVIPNDSENPPAELRPARWESPYVLFLGSLNPRKNLRGAVVGFQALREERPEPIRLLVAGDVNPTVFRSGEAAVGQAEGVVLQGHVGDQERWALLAGARALLCPSFQEGFGLPILEALKVGTPVVASDIPVFRELFDDAVEYVDPGSPESIARGLERVLDDEAAREALLGRAREVRGRYSWRDSARRYLAALDRLVGGGLSRSGPTTPPGRSPGGSA